jgi:ABC-type Na+ efflux pump permease subunit
MASTGLTTVLCAILPRFLPLEEMGIRFRIGPEHLTGIIGAALPMCLFSAALQSAVGTLARSFKEAQSYMGVLVLMPMIPGVLGALYPMGNAPWMLRDADVGSACCSPTSWRTNAGDQRVPHLGWHLNRRGRHPCAHHRHAV